MSRPASDNPEESHMSQPKPEAPTAAQRVDSQGAKRAWHPPRLQTMSIADMTKNSGAVTFTDPGSFNS
jgi:hypothetical protein